MRPVVRPIAIAAAAVMLGGCATDTNKAADSSAGEDEVKYAWQEARDAGEPTRPDCRSRVRRTGSRIPRCPRETGVSGKAYHMPGRTVDDRAGGSPRD